MSPVSVVQEIMIFFREAQQATKASLLTAKCNKTKQQAVSQEHIFFSSENITGFDQDNDSQRKHTWLPGPLKDACCVANMHRCVSSLSEFPYNTRINKSIMIE